MKIQRTKVLPQVAILLIAMIASSIIFMSTYRESGILDDVTHIAAGYSYWKTGSPVLNPEHPPLAKLIAGFPLMFLDLPDPRTCDGWAVGNAMQVGHEIFDRSSVPMTKILHLSQIPMILMGVILILCTSVLAVRLGGLKAGVWAAGFLAFEPLILGHSKTIHTDITVTLGWMLSLLAGLHYAQKPSMQRAVFIGFALGFASMAKFSGLLIIPLFLICWIFAYFAGKTDHIQLSFDGKWSHLIVTGLVIYTVIQTCYWFTFAWPDRPSIAFLEPLSPGLRESIITILLGLHVPWSFVNGIDILWRHNLQGHCAFLLGNYSKHGWLYYFPVAFCLKSTITFILVSFMGVVFCFHRILKGDRKYLILAIPLIFIWTSACLSHINIGIRHILPVYPLCAVAAGCCLAHVVDLRKKLLYPAIAILVVHILITVTAFPHYISYFNFFAGGEKNGWKFLADSNYEWGQGALEAAQYCKNNNIHSVEHVMIGGGYLKYYGLPARIYEPVRTLLLLSNSETNVQMLEGPAWKTGGTAVGEDRYVLVDRTAIQGTCEAHKAFFETLSTLPEYPEALIANRIFLYRIPYRAEEAATRFP